MAVKYRMKFHEPNGRKFTKTAEGTTQIAATAYAVAIAAITNGTVEGATITSDVAGADYPGTNNSGTYSDATFHFRKGTENANAHFEQLNNTYAEVINDEETGFVDLVNYPAITEYASQWSTAHGGGWSLVEARYVK